MPSKLALGIAQHRAVRGRGVPEASRRQVIAAPLVILHMCSRQFAADTRAPIAYPAGHHRCRAGRDRAPSSSTTRGPGGAQPPLCNSATHIAARPAMRSIEHYRVFATGSKAVAHRFAGPSGRKARQPLQCNSPSRWAAAWCAALSTADLNETRRRRSTATHCSSGTRIGHVDCVNVVTHATPAIHAAGRPRARSPAAPAGSSSTARSWSMRVRSHADSQQSCRGLLLSPTAEIDTRPQLEIHTDEVKCAHGATDRPARSRTCCSICCRAAWTATRRRACWSMPSSRMCSPTCR